jgi:hypothetical protein
MHRLMMVFSSLTALVVGLMATALPAGACAGLIGSNGAVNLGRTSTLAAYHDGVEHYVTAFKFQGGGGQFGTLIPLPGVPTSVERGGGWTLQRLVLETEPPRPAAARAALSASTEDSVQVLSQTRVDALDLTVLSGGARGVANWATEHGFSLSPDAPEVLDFYAQRSPIFLAAVFDSEAAAERGQSIGDGTPVHLSIPATNPWVPLRILTLGKQPDDRVEADVFLLTDRQPAFLPGTRQGMSLFHNAAARSQLLDDLRADDGMGWVPTTGWLTQLRLDTRAGDLPYDLAVDASGQGTPSRVAAGLEVAQRPVQLEGVAAPASLALGLLGVPLAIALRRRYAGR